jgi:hypothetical protein
MTERRRSGLPAADFFVDGSGALIDLDERTGERVVVLRR